MYKRQYVYIYIYIKDPDDELTMHYGDLSDEESDSEYMLQELNPIRETQQLPQSKVPSQTDGAGGGRKRRRAASPITIESETIIDVLATLTPESPEKVFRATHVGFNREEQWPRAINNKYLSFGFWI